MRTMSREQAVDDLRGALLHLVDDEHSICEVAARHGIFCRGFQQFSDDELRQRYGWLVERKHPASRHDLEDLANRWQLARQLVRGVSLSCDAQTCDHDTCGGWDDFSDAMLVDFYRKLRGEPIRITGRSTCRIDGVDGPEG